MAAECECRVKTILWSQLVAGDDVIRRLSRSAIQQNLVSQQLLCELSWLPSASRNTIGGSCLTMHAPAVLLLNTAECCALVANISFVTVVTVARERLLTIPAPVTDISTCHAREPSQANAPSQVHFAIQRGLLIKA